jgi:hypothetical protein
MEPGRRRLPKWVGPESADRRDGLLTEAITKVLSRAYGRASLTTILTTIVPGSG